MELVKCLTINEKSIANAEYVIEGEILPSVRVQEDQNSHTGKAMPEFPGYCGPANPSLPIIKVKAVTTRFQADRDLIPIPGVQCHPLDPSNQPEYAPGIRARGVACKAIFDCTVPFDQKDRFERARFMDLDPAHWLPELF